jgi:hypothetical protein
MSNTWLIVEASFPALDARNIIRTFVKPIIDHFENSIVTFHFFFEPHLLLRIESEEDFVIRQLRPYVEQKLGELKAVIKSVIIDGKYSEAPNYRDGWEVAKKMFEYGSRAAIKIAECEIQAITLGSDFNEGKFMHLLLNQFGHDRRQEAIIHLKVVGERLAIEYSNGNMKKVEERLPEICRQLRTQFFPQIDGLVKTAMTKS